MNQTLYWVDYLVLGYLGLTGLFLLAGAPQDPVYQLAASAHVLVMVGIGAVIYASSASRWLRRLRDLYPLLLIGPIYCEIDLYARLVFDGSTFDPIVRQWDLWLFGTHPHQYLTTALKGAFWQELLHAFYLSYFGLLAGSYVWIWRHRSAEWPRFAFVFMGMYLSFMVLFMAFPVTGPMAERSMHFTSPGLFTRAVNAIYGVGEPGGIWTGAFPSSHVGMSVGVVLLLRPKHTWSRIALWTIVAGITLSTTYGWFHYAIDALAGGAVGLALYAGWTRLYDTLSVSTTPSVQSSSPSSPSEPVFNRRK